MSYNSDEIAVKVENLSKAYKIFDTPGKRLKYYLFQVNSGRDFWALRNINFEIKKGETFGIIGKNGSGKSTILQIMAGIIKQTEGSVTINGRISALLELGSGFNPESTGYENIYMNAAILGVTKDKIDEKIDDIVKFADIGDFLYQPVKTYSSGMFVRLAFAVAINVDADVILIDEALAVGDIFFRQKCYARLNQLKEQGKTIILVTHAMGEVEQFCDRAVLLHKSKQIMLGKSQDVVKKYYLINQENDNKVVLDDGNEENEIDLFNENGEFEFADMELSNWAIKDNDFFDLNNSNEISNGKAVITRVGLFDSKGNTSRVFEQGDYAYFYYELLLKDNINVPIVGNTIYNQRNIIVYGKNSMQTYCQLPNKVNKNTKMGVVQRIKLDIEPGEFTFEVGLCEMLKSIYEKRDIISHEEIFGNEKRVCHRSQVGSFSVVMKKIGDPTRLTHHGICNLPTNFKIKFAKFDKA